MNCQTALGVWLKGSCKNSVCITSSQCKFFENALPTMYQKESEHNLPKLFAFSGVTMFDIYSRQIRKSFRPTKFKISMNNFGRHISNMILLTQYCWAMFDKKLLRKKRITTCDSPAKETNRLERKNWKASQKEDYLNLHLKEILPFGVKCSELSVCPEKPNRNVAGTISMPLMHLSAESLSD